MSFETQLEARQVARINALLQSIGLSAELRQQSGLQLEMVNFPQRCLLFKPGDTCQTFLLLLSGTIRVELTSKSGRLITLYKIEAGESCILSTSALLNSERFYVQGVTESAVQALALSAPMFQQSLQCSQGFANFVLSSYAKRMAAIVRLIDKMATRDVASALAEYLLTQQDKQCVKITQQALAMEIGSAREVVSRKLAMLEQQGAIQRRRGQIVIRDNQLLQQFVAV